MRSTSIQRVLGTTFWFLSLISLSTLFPVLGSSSRWEWKDDSRIVALGDVHGSYSKLVQILQGSGLIDGNYKWTGGKSHLVLCGDMTDRGNQERKVLELLMSLQKQARKKGGQVHTLLGNHDAMNLVRDFRYVTEAGWASFAKDESSRERKNAWKAFQKAYTQPNSASNEEKLRAAFNQRFPKGYFARAKAFSKKGRYGSWLLKQPATIKINGLIFVHGGLTPQVALLGLDEINRQVTSSLRTFVDSAEVLESVLTIPAGYSELHQIARRIVKTAETSPVAKEFVQAARALLDQDNALPFSYEGPLWYRGNSLENERAEREPVTRVLDSLGASALMVGHTITRTKQISSRFNNRVYRGDVGMAYDGGTYAMIFQGEEAQVFDPSSGQFMTPLQEPPPGEGRAPAYEHLPDWQFEEVLQNGKILKRQNLSRGKQSAEIWEIESEGLRLRAVFKSIGAGQAVTETHVPRYQHELAAYWLDRKLNLGMIPVVVLRSIDGKQGALRAIIETAIDLVSIIDYGNLHETTREEAIQKISEQFNMDPEELHEQADKVWIFDALIANPNREDEDKLLIPRDRRVVIVDHERAFAPGVSADSLLPKPCSFIDPLLEVGLQSLTREELDVNLGQYLSDEQIEALLARRDRILELCE